MPKINQEEYGVLKVFEAFAGYGSQRMALRNLGIEHEVVATSEVDEYAILSYGAIHGGTLDKELPESEEVTKEYLTKLNVPLTDKGKLKNLSGKRLRRIYNALEQSNGLGDISKIDVNEVPNHDLFTYSFPCFTKDNLVLTEEGYKPINEVSVGDKVLTHNNTYEKVVKTFDNGMQPTVKVKAMGIDEIVTTPNHKFYVREKYREWNNGRRSYERKFKSPEWKEIKDITKDYYLGMAINQESEIPKWEGITFKWNDGRKPRHKNELQELMDNQDFWWIVGRYLADGWTRTQGGIVFGIGKDKTGEFEGRLGKVFNYSTAEEESVVKYHVPLKELSKFVEQFGKGAANKRLSKTVLNLPVDLLESFLEGYFSGDGSFVKGYWKATSVSRELLLGIGQVVMKVYKRPYSLYKDIRPKTAVIEGRTVNQKDSYSLSFKKETKKQDNAFYENGHVWIPFNTIEDTGNENVYDIEVNNAHSFTVQNVIVHNCQDISVAGAQGGFDKGSGTRSGLLWECQRIISAKKPKYLLMENVKNLVGKKFKSGFEEWQEYLTSIGYTNYWEVLNAKDFGIPQNRQRVFMVSILGEHEPYVFPKPIKLEKRLKDVLEEEVDEKYYLEDEKAEQLIATMTDVKDIKQQEGLKMNRNEVSGKSNIAQTLLARDYKGFGNQDMNGVIETERILGIFDKENSTHQAGSVYNKDKIAPTLDTMQGGWRQPSIIDGPKIAASRGRNPENPSDRTKGAPTEQRLEVNDEGTSNTLTTVQKDNYVLESEPAIVDAIYNNREPRVYDECAPTLRSERHGLDVVNKYRIRKLTPLECWRLMDVSDEDFYKAQDVNSNSQLYKQAGNSIVVSVLEAIFRNMFLEIPEED